MDSNDVQRAIDQAMSCTLDKGEAMRLASLNLALGAITEIANKPVPAPNDYTPFQQAVNEVAFELRLEDKRARQMSQEERELLVVAYWREQRSQQDFSDALCGHEPAIIEAMAKDDDCEIGRAVRFALFHWCGLKIDRLVNARIEVENERAAASTERDYSEDAE